MGYGGPFSRLAERSQRKEAGYSTIRGLFNLWIVRDAISALAYSEHLRATLRADALSSRSAVLHGDGLRVAHLSLGTTLHAIRFHSSPPFWIHLHTGANALRGASLCLRALPGETGANSVETWARCVKARLPRLEKRTIVKSSLCLAFDWEVNAERAPQTRQIAECRSPVGCSRRRASPRISLSRHRPSGPISCFLTYASCLTCPRGVPQHSL